MSQYYCRWCRSFIILKTLNKVVPRPILPIVDHLTRISFIVGRVLICKIKVLFVLAGAGHITKQ